MLVWQVLLKSKTHSITELNQEFQATFLSEKVTCYSMPLVSVSTLLSHFLGEYLTVLCQLNYITITGDCLTVQHQLIHFPSSEEREQLAVKLLNDYRHISSTPYQNMLL